MSMVEELKAVIAAKAPWWGYHAHAVEFIEKHGQALVEAVADAERYRFIRDSDGPGRFWIAHGNLGEGVSRWTGEHADRQIDIARTKASAGGGA